MARTTSTNTFHNTNSIRNNEGLVFTFNKIGTYEYICGIHPSMKRAIVVEQRYLFV